MSAIDHVLEKLEENKGTVLSGRQLAEGAGVSRAAVWKTIHRLQEQGYRITALPNRGYRLEESDDRLSAQAIRRSLDERYRGAPLFVYSTIDSTNQEAKRRLLEQPAHRTVILSEEQTDGRGRLGRSFYSPAATGLYFSAILRLDLPLAQAGCVTIAAANAVCRGLEELGVADTGIKWVNDVYRGGRKICGILTEGSSSWETGRLETAIVGIGVNVSTTDFPGELAQKAASVFLPPGSRSRLAGRVLSHLFALTENWDAPALMEEYKRRSVVLGKSVRYQKDGAEHFAKAVDVNEVGNLVVEENGARRVLSSGEISVRLCEGGFI